MFTALRAASRRAASPPRSPSRLLPSPRRRRRAAFPAKPGAHPDGVRRRQRARRRAARRRRAAGAEVGAAGDRREQARAATASSPSARCSQAAPDGHDLIQLDSNHLTTHPHTFSRLPYDPQKDLEPVRPLFRNSFFVAVAKDSPYKSLGRHRRRGAAPSPGSVSYGSWFNGSPGHLGGLRLQKMQGHRDAACALQGDDPALRRRRDAARWTGRSAARPAPGRWRRRASCASSPSPGRRARRPIRTCLRSTRRRRTRGYEVVGLDRPVRARRARPRRCARSISADLQEALEAPEVAERYRGFDYELFDAGPDAFAELIRRETAELGRHHQGRQLKLD